MKILEEQNQEESKIDVNPVRLSTERIQKKGTNLGSLKDITLFIYYLIITMLELLLTLFKEWTNINLERNVTLIILKCYFVRKIYTKLE